MATQLSKRSEIRFFTIENGQIYLTHFKAITFGKHDVFKPVQESKIQDLSSPAILLWVCCPADRNSFRNAVHVNVFKHQLLKLQVSLSDYIVWGEVSGREGEGEVATLTACRPTLTPTTL